MERITLAAILILGAAFGIGHAFLTPYRTPGIQEGRYQADIGAPDERAHANYVIHLIEGQGIPVLDPKRPDAWEHYESHQPPLYYLLAAAWSKALATGNLVSRQGGVALRMLSVIFGALAALGVYFASREAFGSRAVALAAAASVALLPMVCAVNAWVGNDAMLTALCAWTLALAFRARECGWTRNHAALLGLCIGAAVLTKTSALALVPPLVLVFAVGGRHRPSVWQVVVIAMAAAALIAPWWARNVALYGDPFALSAFREQFGGNPYFEGARDDSARLRRWASEFTEVTGMSFVGMFGYMHILLPKAAYVAAWCVYGLLLAGWPASWFSARLRDRRPEQLIALAAILTAIALYVRFNLEQHQPQARYLFPALAPIGMAFGIGLSGWFSKRTLVATWALILFLAALNVLALSLLPGEFASRTRMG